MEKRTSQREPKKVEKGNTEKGEEPPLKRALQKTYKVQGYYLS